MLIKFDGFVDGSLPFSYTDVVADFYGFAYPRVADLSAKWLILSRLLDMGWSHNRWHVGEVLGGLVGNIKDPAEVLQAKAVLEANPTATAFAGRYILQNRPVAAIRSAVNADSAS